MKYFVLVFAVSVIYKIDCFEERHRRNVVTIMNLIDDYCDSEKYCIDEVSEDLLFTISRKTYDPSDVDYGVSRITALMESIDDKCFDDQGCIDDIVEDLRDDLRTHDNSDDDDQEEDDDDDDDFDEQQFEELEFNSNKDETVLNNMYKDECQQNPVACKKFVDKEERLGLNHIGRIDYGEDREPIVKIPKSLFFREELRIKDGGDDPEK